MKSKAKTKRIASSAEVHMNFSGRKGFISHATINELCDVFLLEGLLSLP